MCERHFRRRLPEDYVYPDLDGPGRALLLADEAHLAFIVDQDVRLNGPRVIFTFSHCLGFT